MGRDGKFVDSIGIVSWFKDNVLHKEDGPAVIWPNGTEFWYNRGKLHRDDGPAVSRANGARSWYFNGKKVDPIVAFCMTKGEKDEP